MAYLALYRKYRPQSFDSLIGQDNIVKTLINQIQNDRLGHAYLFTGTRGTGKTSAAKIFAKAVNCLHPINGSPCGECDCCIALSDPSNIDVIEIDAASNNGVNEIRDLREKVQYPPVSCKYKVYIIDEVHMLTGAAFNALLKTLEEPPKHAIFILATTEAHKIPATILSRCMRFDFKLISIEKIASLIGKIYDEQGKEYDKEAIYAIAKAGEGSIRDALSVADMAISFSQSKLTYEDVMEVLGATNQELLNEFVTSVLMGDSGHVMTVVDQLSALGKSIGVLTKDVTALLRDLTIVKICEDPNEILSLPKDKFDTLQSIADLTNTERLLRCLEIFSNAENSLKYSNHSRIIFETASLKASRPDSDYDIDALIARIKSLEEKLEQSVQIRYKQEPIVKDENVERKIAPSVEKPSIDQIGNDISGELLTNLRKNEHEMLWIILQNAEMSIASNVLTINVNNSTDLELLSKEENKKRIEEALDNYQSFAIQIKLSDSEKIANKLDEEAERIKKIFGEDIVIIKED